MSQLQMKAIKMLSGRRSQISYSQLGRKIGAKPRGVGRIVSTLAERGYARLCKLVTYKKNLE